MVFFDYNLLPGNNQDNEQDSNENTNNNAGTLTEEQIANGLRNA